MANKGEDGNGLCYGFLKKRQDVSSDFRGFKFGSKNVEILQKCCCSVDFFKKLLLVIQLGLIKFQLHKFRDNFVNL